MTIDISNLSLDQLKRAVSIKEQIEALGNELAGILGTAPTSSATPSATPGKRFLSEATKAKMRAAHQARWAKLKGVKSAAVPKKGPGKPKFRLSEATKAKMRAAHQARWAKIKGVKVQAAPKQAPVPAKPKGKVSAAGRLENPISLPKAVLQVTSKKPMTRQEVLEAVLKLGYRFQTKEPMKSLNPILYGKNPKFDRVDGKFSAPKNAGVKAVAEAPVTKTPPPAPVAQKPKRKLSAAGRAAIIAATKARWAKVKAEKI